MEFLENHNFRDLQSEVTMLANNIEIFQRRFKRNSARRRANVALSMSYRSVSLYCQITLPKRQNAPTCQSSEVQSGRGNLRLVTP